MKNSGHLRWMLRQTRYCIKVLWTLPVICVVLSACYVAVSMIFKGYMDIAASEGSVTFFQMTVFSVTTITVLALTQVASSVLEGHCYSKTESGLRTYFMGLISQKDLLALNKMHTGEVQNRLTTDVATVSDFFIKAFGQMSLLIFTSLFSITALLLLNWKITILFLMVIPLLTGLTATFFPKLQKAAEIDSKNEDANRSYMQEVLNRLPLLQVYPMGKNVGEFTRTLYEKKKKSKARLSFLEGAFGFVNSLTSFGVFIITSAVGVYFVIKGDNTVGDLVAMIQLSNYIILPLTEIPKLISSYNSAINSVKRMREIEGIKENHAIPFSPHENFAVDSIRLDHLSFAYDETEMVLDDVHAVFEKNKIIGIVGKSGSGKSTLIKLILGLYNPEKPNMIQMLSEQSTQNYYHHENIVSYVPSDDFVFNASVKDNICMNLPYDKDKFDRVCKEANVHDLVDHLPLKENAMIKENGNNLSMGQKQRLAIARALYADTSIIIFDEPTANLDQESKNLFKIMIRSFSQNRICIIVTHDDAVASICDDVYRLEGKRLVVKKEV